MSEDFWELIEEYRQLGFDPLRWIPTCSNEIDTYLFQASLKNIKRSNIKITPNWFDAFPYAEGKGIDLTRRIYSFDNPEIEKEVEIKRALSIFRIHINTGENSTLLSEAIQRFMKSFHSKVLVKKVATSLTAYAEAQFALLDYIELHRGDKVGYMSANNSVTHITDPTHSPDSEIHSNISLTAAMEYLNLLGCTSGFKVFPVYDAPNENIVDKIRENLDRFTSRYNLAMEDYSSLKVGKLFFGATAIANTLKELPTRYDQSEEGMQIVLSNKLGSLTAISLYMLTEMDHNNITKFTQNGIGLDVLSAAKDEAMKSLIEPHFALGKIISKYCPDFGTEFDKHTHITAVHPVTTDGIFAVGRLAELTNSHIVINELPMKYEEVAKFATREFLIDNSTVSTNGCHLIIVTKEVANYILEDLRKYNFEPTVIGFISKKGEPGVAIGNEISEYVASKVKLARLTSPAQAGSQQHE
ncbi:MAG: SelD-related putative sulfur metabolism protein [Thermoproteota archaeon]|nr:SelD-related putative sulfur metabolism protein [Thermoproteota archaeon]